MIATYFNYFTEIEEHFQRARGVTRMLSPRDWALVERWKNTGVPLEAVLRGIDAVFETRRKRPVAAGEPVNSLAYCASAVVAEAQQMAASMRSVRSVKTPWFSRDKVQVFIHRNAHMLRSAGIEDLADLLDAIDLKNPLEDLDQLEQGLNAIEEKMIARIYLRISPEELGEARRSVVMELEPYRKKMNNDQIVALEKQLLDRRVVAGSGLPRLSLFYAEDLANEK